MFHFIFRRKLLLNNHNNVSSTKRSTAKALLLPLFHLQQNPPSLKLFSDIPSSDLTEPQVSSPFTFSYLINSCGLSPDSALSICQKIQLKSAKKPDSVLKILKIHGFSNTQITELISKCPKLLLHPLNTLKAKFQYFLGLGMSVPILHRVLLAEPKLFHVSLQNRIIPAVDFLKTLVHTNDNIVFITRRWAHILRYDLNNVMAPKISVLQNHGVPNSKISKLITIQPRALLNSNSDRLKEIVVSVKEMGFNPITSGFMLAISVMLRMTKANWEKKVEVYRNLGWSDDDFLTAFKIQPYCMVISEKKIKEAIEYFANEMDLRPTFLSKYPALVCLSLEKRVMPRCSILQILVSQGLVKKDSMIAGALKVTEKEFLRAFVIKYEGSVPDILTMYQNKMKHAGLEIGSKEVGHD